MPIDAFSQALAHRNFDQLAAAYGARYEASAGLSAGESTAGAGTSETSGDISFDDILDVVNPLHHVPLVSTLYRELTNDTVAPHSRIIGGFLWGGPIGGAAAMVNAGVHEATGKDIGGHAMAALFGDDETNNSVPRPVLMARAGDMETAEAAPATLREPPQTNGTTEVFGNPTAAAAAAHPAARIQAEPNIATVASRTNESEPIIWLGNEKMAAAVETARPQRPPATAVPVSGTTSAPPTRPATSRPAAANNDPAWKPAETDTPTWRPTRSAVSTNGPTAAAASVPPPHPNGKRPTPLTAPTWNASDTPIERWTSNRPAAAAAMEALSNPMLAQAIASDSPPVRRLAGSGDTPADSGVAAPGPIFASQDTVADIMLRNLRKYERMASAEPATNAGAL